MNYGFAAACAVTLGACTGGEPPGECVDDETFFATEVEPILLQDCAACHVAGGAAADTRHVLISADDPDHSTANLEVWRELASVSAGGESILLAKPTLRTGHGGGRRFEMRSTEYDVFREMVARIEAPGGCEDPGGGGPVCEPGGPNPGSSPLRRLTDAQYAAAVRDLIGVDPDPGLFPLTVHGNGFGTWPESNSVSAAGVEGILLSAEQAASRVDTGPILDCGQSADACASAWIDDFAYRAYRRPVDAAESEGLHAIYALGADPDDGVRLVIEVVLQSPQFLYLSGRSIPTDRPGVEALDDFAVAERLSFFLLGTAPDAALMATAERGELHTPAQVRSAASLMLDDPRVLPTIAAFHRDWLRTERLDTIAKDADVYPEFDAELVADMRTELDLNTTEVLWSEDPRFETLMYSQTTWTSPRLDAIYGTSDARTGQGWERRELGPDRPGILSRTAFLTANSYSATSAPVRRGSFVLKGLLCEDLTPPPGVDLTLPEETETNTIRERLAEHRADPSCASCHDRIDPIGFSMEHYGALGEWRDDWENGIPVDATGELARPPGSFDGLGGMIAVIDSDDVIEQCYARQWFEYGVGHGPLEADPCAMEATEARFVSTGGDIRDLLLTIVTSDAFLYVPEPVVE